MLFGSDRKLATADLGFEEKVYVGSQVMRVGCGNGTEPRIDQGYVSCMYEHSIKTGVYTIPGDSGSGVFCNYRLIGLAQAVGSIGDQTEEEGDKTLEDFLKPKWESPRTPLYGVSYVIPIRFLLEWDKEAKGALEFVYNHNIPLPVKVIKQDNTKRVRPQAGEGVWLRSSK